MSAPLFRLVGINCRHVHSCPALFYLRRELGRRLPQVSTEIRQFSLADPYYPALSLVAAGPPTALFFSAYVWNAGWLKRLLPDLARLLPETHLVAGGPQAPYLFADSDKASPPPRLVVFHGEIEAAPPAFWTDLDSGKLAGTYRAGPARQWEFPYRPEDFAGALGDRHIYYESSRGCPFRCSYCLSAAEAGVRRRPLALVLPELDMIVRQRPRSIRFVDRSFNDESGRALAIWRHLAARNGDGGTVFHFELAPQLLTDEDVAALAAVPPGIFEFEAGIQSSTPEVLAAVCRQAPDPEALARIARLASRGNIHVHVDLILGLPLESPASFADSFRRVFALGAQQIQMGLLKLLPGTPLAEMKEKFGIVSCRLPPYEVLATASMPAAALMELFWFGRTVESFHNNRWFVDFWRWLKESGEDAFAFFLGLCRFCPPEEVFGRAPTQDFLHGILQNFVQNRADAGMLTELLAFSWLRSGRKALPPALADSLPESAAVTRRRLIMELPQSMTGLFAHSDRAEFFKNARFLKMTAATARAAGIGVAGGDAIILPQPEESVHRLQSILFLEH